MENNHAAVRVKLIDFGSALDLQCWVCPALQLVFHDLGGWQQATRTIDYCPPVSTPTGPSNFGPCTQ